ncbi:MobF family relaxase [Duganella phyllosphaerae]|uniref:Multifunctional conjugation protein TraI n=1 Tax=Duganella phyllosphaerae TaxID=762836 RepID=A0A1E7WH80_9BURK|nr:MobF family relaxase [Duganella phyllosphaerae]OEZ97978.1 multifunctional conjugation protein TraI [Duganella phyllosphaerae]
MLSITKINSTANQSKKGQASQGYLHYLGGPNASTRQRGDFDDYARGGGSDGPAPFWACGGASLLGLAGAAEAKQVERLAQGFHPLTGEPLVKGAGSGHVMGLDMTFSAPKDFSAIFAGADSATRDALVDCLHQSARVALGYAETAVVTRHGRDGGIRRIAEAAIAACYTHFASRALDPQLHVHAFMFNVGKRSGSKEWSALELRPQFERKMATGILFRAELAHRLRRMGFGILPDGPYFTLEGIDEAQRESLSTRSKQIADYLRDAGGGAGASPAEREIAALNTRSAKSEPSLPELIGRFEEKAASIGITPASVAAMRAPRPEQAEPFAIDHAELLVELTESQSCSTPQEALAKICEKAMGHWSAAECLAELDRFMLHEHVIQLGHTGLLTPVFTSRATRDMEADISAKVGAGKASMCHRLSAQAIGERFDDLETQLRAKLGVDVSLAQQRAAALHVACETGVHAFVEGWAGTGKTTMLQALGSAYKQSGFEVLGCCQSAAAAQNLGRETGIQSRTIASLLLSLQKGRMKLSANSILFLDEAGMVGSREFAALQHAVLDAGAKLVAVGDPKQLQPIDAGGIFAALMREHGKAEISNIQRQRTDFEPLLAWLDARATRSDGGLSVGQAQALRATPEDARLAAIEAICSTDAKLSHAFSRWRDRYDFQWMREAVELFATGEAKSALALLDARGRLKLMSGQEEAYAELISAWSADRTPLRDKAIVAGTRAEVAELNQRARQELIAANHIDASREIEVEIVHRDETTDIRRFAPGDRIVFTKNDRPLGVANGLTGAIRDIDMSRIGGPLIAVELDAPNERGDLIVHIPASFGRFDLGFALTTHRAQGRTLSSAHALVNPSMGDREWSYVAASRSRFATTLYVNTALLDMVDHESHAPSDAEPKSHDAIIDALASRMRRSRPKGTSLDYAGAPDASPIAPNKAGPPSPAGQAWAATKKFFVGLRSKALAKSQGLSR